jgi:ketosteroid isomerase-like protein
VQSPPSRDIAASFYAGFATQQYAEAIRPLLSSDIVWHIAENNPLAGEFRGQDEVFAAMRRFVDHSLGTLHLETQCVLGEGQHAVAIHAATAHRDELDYAAHEVDVFHVVDGLIVEMWSFSENQAATDALWSVKRIGQPDSVGRGQTRPANWLR